MMRLLLVMVLLAGCTGDGSSEQELFSRQEPFQAHAAKGTYQCRKCGQAVFQSDRKLKVGSRWPVFSQPMVGKVNVQNWKEEGELRHKVNCGSCHLHLGYLCEDGEIARGPDGGDQYCVLSSALRFVPAAD